MTKDNRLLKKMFLLNESSFQKIKEIEDTERNFNALDKAMRAILYNKKLNNHEKLMQYTELLEKYLKMRKQLIAKYGEDSVKSHSIKEEKPTNPFESAVKNNFPRLSNVFNTTVNPEKLKFNNTLPIDGDTNQTNNISMLDIQQNIPKNNEEYFDTSGEFGDDVQLPPISASSVARESSIGDRTMIDLSSTGNKVVINWKGMPYTIDKRFEKNFNVFTKKIQMKYPLAKSFALSDFLNYIVNGSVIVKSIEEKKMKPPVQRLERKRKSATNSTIEEKKMKSVKLDVIYPERKKQSYVLHPSKLTQVGKGFFPKKWITLR